MPPIPSGARPPPGPGGARPPLGPFAARPPPRPGGDRPSPGPSGARPPQGPIAAKPPPRPIAAKPEPGADKQTLESRTPPELDGARPALGRKGAKPPPGTDGTKPSPGPSGAKPPSGPVGAKPLPGPGGARPPPEPSTAIPAPGPGTAREPPGPGGAIPPPGPGGAIPPPRPGGAKPKPGVVKPRPEPTTAKLHEGSGAAEPAKAKKSSKKESDKNSPKEESERQSPKNEPERKSPETVSKKEDPKEESRRQSPKNGLERNSPTTVFKKEDPKEESEKKSPRNEPERKSSKTISKEEDPVEESEEEVLPAQPKHPSVRDILFISVLWTTQMFYYVVDVLLERYTDEYLTTNEPESRETGVKGTINTWSLLLITVLAMVATGAIVQYVHLFPVLKVTETFKFWITYGLLTVYFLSGPAGILLTATKSTAVRIAITWLQIGWNIFSPIRFWYIFHQFFPISIRWSHLIVSGNILAIGIVEYIIEIQVNDANRDVPFSELFYYGAFAITTVAAIGWLVGLIFLKRYQQRVLGDLSSVREVYENTEVIEKFDRQQRLISIILFMALIIPAVMIPVMNKFVKLGPNKLSENAVSLDLNLVRFRPDLLLSLLVVVVVEVVLQFLRKIRNELSDLVFVGTSHIINIVVVVLFIIILNQSENTRKVMGETKTANLVLYNNLRNFIRIDVGSNIHDLAISGYKELQIEDVSEDGTVLLVVKNGTTRQLLHEGNIRLEVHRCSRVEKKYFINVYMLRGLKGSVQFFKAPISHVDANDYRPIFFCPIETCTDYDYNIAKQLGLLPDITTGVLSDTGKCLPISWQIHLKEDILPNTSVSPPFKPPAYDAFYRFPIEVPCGPMYSNVKHSCQLVQVVFYQLAQYFSMVYPEEAKDVYAFKNVTNCIVGPGIVTLQSLKYEAQRGISSYDLPTLGYAAFSLPEPLPETRLLVAMSFYGLSLGIAWVGYIHFIWIQCPVRLRMVIIFIFFSLIYVTSSLSERLLTKFNEENALIILAFAMLCTFWQIGTTILFAVRWAILHQNDQPQLPWHRF